MPFRISFFNTPKHRVFHYTPRFWNPEKEALEARIAAAKSEKEKDELEKQTLYKPGSTIRGAFQKAAYESRGYPKHQGLIRGIVVLSIIVLLGALVYFSDMMGLLFEYIASK